MVQDHANDGGETDYQRIYDALSTRRRFLAGAAGVGTTALAGCTGTGGEETGSPTDEPAGGGTETEGMEETETETQTMTNPDVDVLNYALTLERLEYNFYEQGLQKFSDEQLRNADPVKNFDQKVKSELPGRIKTIRDHEKGHVDSIASVVKKLGGEPVGKANYQFKFPSATKFLATAKVLENTGVAAYKGAAPAIKQNKILASALGIHSVEARHASFLNFVNRKSPFPRAFDPPKSPKEVKKAANPFFKSDITKTETDLSTESEPMAERKEEDDVSDLNVLNYALTLEHLEHAFYRDGLETFGDDEIMHADALSEFGETVRSKVPERLKTVRDHEKAHVDTIKATVKKLGGDPVKEAEYTFEYKSPSKFLGTARVLENTGVAAYAGAAPTVKNDKIFVAAAKIHSVEARHAGFLNELNEKSPYPSAVDEAKSIEEVKEAIKPFIKSSG